MTASYIVVRDIDPEADPTADRYGAPQLPAEWTVSRIDPTQTPIPAWTVQAPGAPPALVTRVNAVGARGLYLVRGDKAWLDSLDPADAGPARKVWRLAQEGNATARAVVRRWRFWRCDVLEPATQEDVDSGLAAELGEAVARNDVRRELCAEGVSLPNPATTPLPWTLDADGNLVAPELAVRVVVGLYRPVMHETWGGIAGHADHVAFENEEDPGAGG